MMFVCLECHCETTVVPMFLVGDIFKCPKCKAEYETIELIQPHIMHKIPILKHRKTSKITTLQPLVFAVNMYNSTDVERYFGILESLES